MRAKRALKKFTAKISLGQKLSPVRNAKKMSVSVRKETNIGQSKDMEIEGVLD
jgi:hypothetical protein